MFDLPQNTTRQNASFEHQFPVCCRLMPIFTSVTASKKHHQKSVVSKGLLLIEIEYDRGLPVPSPSYMTRCRLACLRLDDIKEFYSED